MATAATPVMTLALFNWLTDELALMALFAAPRVGVLVLWARWNVPAAP